LNYLSVKDYSIKYNISSSSIYRKIKSGTIEYEVRGGRKFVLDKSLSGDIVKSNESNQEQSVQVIIEEKDRFNSILESEVKMLRRKTEKLERHLVLINNYFDENFNFSPKEQIELENSVSELSEYLMKKGFDKRSRKIIYNRFNNLSGTEERIIIKDNDYLLDFSRYNYDDLLRV